MEDHSYELYDLSTDPGESENLDQRNLPVEDTLKAMLSNWWQATNAPIPETLNPEYDATFTGQAQSGREWDTGLVHRLFRRETSGFIEVDQELWCSQFMST